MGTMSRRPTAPAVAAADQSPAIFGRPSWRNHRYTPDEAMLTSHDTAARAISRMCSRSRESRWHWQPNTGDKLRGSIACAASSASSPCSTTSSRRALVTVRSCAYRASSPRATRVDARCTPCQARRPTAPRWAWPPTPEPPRRQTLHRSGRAHEMRRRGCRPSERQVRCPTAASRSCWATRQHGGGANEQTEQRQFRCTVYRPSD